MADEHLNTYNGMVSWATGYYKDILHSLHTRLPILSQAKTQSSQELVAEKMCWYGLLTNIRTNQNS